MTGNSWQKTYLDQTSIPIDWTIGFPVHDEFGDSRPSLPIQFSPSLLSDSSGLHVIGLDHSDTSWPAEIDTTGFPIYGDFFSLSVSSFSGSLWSSGNPFSNFTEGIINPHFVDRTDDVVSVAYWAESFLYVETLESPSNTRITLPIPMMFGDVAIDAEGGLHVAVINPNYELWHYYFDGVSSLSTSQIESGPVCRARIAAGQGDTAHIVYSTFSEDANYNGVLDDGEDLNDNATLDEPSLQLIYQRMDGAVEDFSEAILSDTIFKLCHLDLHNTNGSELHVVFEDLVRNSVRLASKANDDLSSWVFQTVSSSAGQFAEIAIAENHTTSPSAPDYAVSYVRADGSELLVSELSSGVWQESVVAENNSGGYFRGADVGFDVSGETIVVAY